MSLPAMGMTDASRADLERGVWPSVILVVPLSPCPRATLRCLIANPRLHAPHWGCCATLGPGDSHRPASPEPIQIVTCRESSRNFGVEADRWVDDPAFAPGLLPRAITILKDHLRQALQLIGGGDVRDRGMYPKRIVIREGNPIAKEHATAVARRFLDDVDGELTDSWTADAGLGFKARMAPGAIGCWR